MGGRLRRTGAAIVGRWTVWVVVLTAAAAVVNTAFRRDFGDVAVYRHGARALFGRHLYDWRDATGHGFTDPPFAALVFDLVAWLPTQGMWLAIDVASACALGLLLRLSLGTVRDEARTGRRLPVVVAVLLVAQPVTANFRAGQIDILLAAAVVADIVALRRGVLVGLAAAVKLTPGLFVVHLLVCGRRREAATAAATFAAATGIGFAVAPHSSWTYWTHTVLTGAGIGDQDSPGNQSVRGLADRVLGDHAGVVAWELLLVPMLVLGLCLARAVHAAGRPVLACGLVGIAACLVSPVSWTHHWVWIIPLVGGAIEVPFSGRGVRRYLIACGAVVVAWTIAPSSLQSAGGIRVVGAGYVVLAVLGVALGGYEWPRSTSAGELAGAGTRKREA